MAIGTLRRRLFVNDHDFGVNHARLRMALVTSDAGVAALQGEMRSSVVIEGGGNPALRIVAVRTRCLASLCELAVMSVLVAIFANLRRDLEQYFFLANWHLVTIAALDGAVRSEQRELGFRMVEASHFAPRPYVVTGFASLRSAIGAQLGLLFLKFTVMGVFMAARTAHVFPPKWKELVGPPRSPHFVAFVAPDGSMRANERIP